MNSDHIISALVQTQDSNLIQIANCAAASGGRCCVITKQDISDEIMYDSIKVDSLDKEDASSIVRAARYHYVYVLSDMDYLNNYDIQEIVAGFSASSFSLELRTKVARPNTQIIINLPSKRA